MHIGDRIAVRCDGCASDLVARVSFISAQAEFTPPVIYSQEERARLVFRVEAIARAARRICASASRFRRAAGARRESAMRSK